MRINAAQALQAAKALGLELEGLTPAAVTDAYRTAAKACHPDSAKHDAARWHAIGCAKALLEDWLADPTPKAEPVTVCAACHGTGRAKLKGKLTMFCVLCAGSGVVRR